MKFTPIVAMIIVGIDCFEKAVSDTQTLFTADAQWLWFIIGTLWLLYALVFAIYYKVYRLDN